MGLFKRILVPVDGSRYSRDAVRLAIQIAKIHQSQLKIFHVLDISLLDQLSRFSPDNGETMREELGSSAQGFMRDMEREAAEEGIELSMEVQEGIPHETILEEISVWEPDLIVMGKLGRRGVAHILLGSVTERVVEFSDVPVLVVK